MTNINEQMSNFARKSGISQQDIEKAGKNIQVDWHNNADKSFDTSNGLSKQEFTDMVGSVSKNGDTETVKQSAELIFDGLDENGDGKLSASELSVFNKSGTKVSAYDLMHTLGTINESVMSQYNPADLATEDDEIELEGSAYGMSDTAIVDNGGSGSGSAAASASASSADTEFQSKFKSDADAKKYIDSFIGGNIKTYDQAIAFLESSGVKLTDEDRSYLEGIILKESMSADEKAKVENLVNTTDMSFKEAAEALKKQGLIDTDPGSIMSKNLLTGQPGASQTGTLNDAQIDRNVEKLYESMKKTGFLKMGFGTDEDRFDSVIFNDDINGVDMAKIALKYNEEHGSLIKDIRDEFSGDEEDKRVQEYATKLVEGANSGDPDCIKALAKELHGSMKGAGTCELFVQIVMDNASDEVLADINNHFKDYTGSKDSLLEWIEDDFDGWGERDIQTSHMDRIKDAVAAVGDYSSSNLSSSQIENEADKLYDSMDGSGTNESKFEKVLYGQKSPDDLAAIASKYIDENGSLLNDIRGDFSGKTEDAHVEQYATQLVEAANNGSQDAIRALTKEMYSSMKGAGTNEVFVEVVMSKANDDVLAAINNNFKDYNDTSKSLEKMIKGDFSFKTEDKYLERLNDAIANSQ